MIKVLEREIVRDVMDKKTKLSHISSKRPERAEAPSPGLGAFGPSART